MNGVGLEASLVNDGVWLNQSSFSSAEESFFCKEYGTGPAEKRHKSPGPVHFDGTADKKQSKASSKNNNNRQNSKSPHQQRFNDKNGHQNYAAHNGGYHGHRQGGGYGYHPYGNYQGYQGGYYGGHGQGGAQYYRNNQYYTSHHQQQFGELKQHIAQARQTIQRALRHSGARNSGGGAGGGRNSGNWGENGRRSGGERRGGGRNSNRNSKQSTGASDSEKKAAGEGEESHGGRTTKQNNNKANFSHKKRTRTVSFGDTVNEELNGRIAQLETENSQLHHLTESLQSKLVELLERVAKLEITNEVQ